MPTLLVTSPRLTAQVLDGQSCRLCSLPPVATAQRPVPVFAAKRFCRRHGRLYASRFTSDELDAEVDQAFRDAINEVPLLHAQVLHPPVQQMGHACLQCSHTARP